MARATTEEPKQVKSPETHSIDVPTTAQRELARLLASGATHETVAHRLNTPVRTIRRRIAALMKQLDAVSPFQAGGRSRSARLARRAR
jgi:DNA-binding NarL/FixJ family response regulator